MNGPADGPELIANPHGAGFASDYANASSALAPFYAGSPWDVRAYERKAAEIDARFDAGARARLSSILRPNNADARARLEAVAAGNGYLVTTGQQAGLMVSPMYTIYKALSAVALADTLQERLGKAVLPVFWIASEDHDWAEVNAVHLLDTANRLHRFELEDSAGVSAGGTGPSVARRLVGEQDAIRLIEGIREVLPATEFRDVLLKEAIAAYGPGGVASFSVAFETLLASMLSEVPLAFVQASDPELKRASIPILRAELENGAKHEAIVRARTEALEAAGYEPQVPVMAGAENVFHERDAGRERLMRADGGWTTRGSGTRLDRAAAFAELQSDPVRFSPNVFLRPVIESAALPTLAYVAGPAELRYFAQIGCLFEAHGVGMPLVMPRASFTIVEAKIRKVLAKFGLAVPDLAMPPQELAARVMADAIPDDVAAALNRLRASIEDGYGVLDEGVKLIDPTLKGPVNRARSAAFSGLADLEKRIVKQLKARNEVTLEQIEKARVNLFPGGKPQERLLSPLQYLARYGESLIGQIRSAIRYELDAAAPEWTGADCR